MERLIDEKVIDYISNNVPRDSDTHMGEGGLVYCNRCNTPRQRAFAVDGLIEQRNVWQMCRCMTEEYERKEAEARQREREQKIERYRRVGFPDKEMRNYRFENDDKATPTLSNAMQAYCENFPMLRREGKGLLLYGNVGTGKSFYAACIVNDLIDKGYRCLLTNFSRLSNQISSLWEGKQEYIDSLCRYALIAIDDLGVERDTEYMNEQVTTLIDSFYRAKVPMLITSNYTPRQLTEDCEIRKRRIYDRLLERCHPVKIDGASRRKAIGRSGYADMNRLLGL